MTKNDLRIVFMGTPDFAVASLRLLVENNYNIVAVVTMPDKPSGRGHKIQYSAVKQYALDNNLPILQPEKLKDNTFISQLEDLKADLQIVVAFRMLPEIVWDMPRLGTFNLHASLLPQYRGAAPINWAIMNGETETGATTFFLTHEIDTGKIILQQKLSIGNDDNVGKVYTELMQMGAKLAVKTVELILEDKVDAIDQSQFIKDESELKSAPKIFKETCKIDWNRSNTEIHNHIRGLSPYPTAWTELQLPDNRILNVKLYESTLIEKETSNLKAGTLITDNKTYIHVVCGDNHLIEINELQLPNKKAMKTEELLRGYKFEDKSYFK